MRDAIGDVSRFEARSFNYDISSLVTAAHELKSPLSIVRQLSLSLDDENISPAERKRILQQITLTSEQAIRLTSDLTKSARLQDAMFELEPINPYQLCLDIIHELKPFIEAHGRNLKLVSCNRSLLTIANRDLLRRIIMNFSDNALNYNEKSSTIEIRIGSLKSGSVIRLGVRDYGPALPNSVFKMIRNNRLNNPLPIHCRPQSSGLGIFIASQFADAMNGNIGVTRHRDGVTFYVDLNSSRQLKFL
jgi:K+-sensing histidine kinase KdpD